MSRSDPRTNLRNEQFLTEAPLQSSMMKALKDLGFDLRYHAFRAHRLDTPGFLDITAIHRDAGLLWTAEMKGPTTVRTDAQRTWIDGWSKVRRIHCAGFVGPGDYDRALADLTQLLKYGGRA